MEKRFEKQNKKQPLRIAHITGKMNTGGVRTVLLNYYAHVDKSAVQFDFFVDGDSCDVPTQEIEAMGGRIFVIPPYQRLSQYLRVLRRLLREGGYTIVHAHINTLCVFPLFAAWCARVPVRICHNHSTAHKSEGKRLVLKYLLRPFARLFATDYLACGEKAGRWLFGEKCFDAGRVTVITNAVDTGRFYFDPAARETLREELGLAQDAFVVGHVGRFIHQKNHAGLLKIFAAVRAQSPGARLLLVGEGELLDGVKAAVAADAALADATIFTGARTDVDKLYAGMDVFCLPSFFEGMPVVAAETQANGLPCVYSNQVTPEAGITTLVRFVPLADSPDAWAQAILEQKDACGTRRSWDKEVADAGFDIVRQADKLTQYYVARAGR